MAVLSNFFVASPQEMTPGVLQAGPDGMFPTIAATSFTTLDLALLLQIARGDNLDDDSVIAALDQFEDVLCGGVEGPWLSRCPEDLRAVLAKASDAAAAAYAARWTEAEELADMDVHTAASLVQNLCTLARSAQATGKDLYLWVSL